MQLLDYLKARMPERSSRVQLVSMAVLALLLLGAVTVDQLTTWTALALAATSAASQLAGILVPDHNRAVAEAAAQDEAVAAALDMATAAAERAAGPKATEAAKNVAAIVERLGL